MKSRRSRTTKGFPGADFHLASSTRNKSITPSSVCIVSVVCDSVTFALTKATRSGGPEREPGASTTTTLAALPPWQLPPLELWSQTGVKENILCHSTFKTTFSPPWNTQTHCQHSPKEKVCLSAEFLVCRKLSGCLRDPVGTLWDAFRAVTLPASYYNGGSMSYICPNPQNVQCQEGTVTGTADFGRQWLGSSVVRKVPLWQGHQ